MSTRRVGRAGRMGSSSLKPQRHRAELRIACGMLLLLATALACSESPPDDSAEAEAIRPILADAVPCDHRDPDRNLFWGELHVHTGISSDAWRSDVRTTPSEAYQFAMGEAIALPPLDESGRGTRPVRLDRPLDFAAITDHAEQMGVLALCGDPASDAYDSQGCQYFRRLPPTPAFKPDADLPPRGEITRMICGEDFGLCQASLETPWQTIQDAAARWNDTSPACRFTTFVAYEWSGAGRGPLLHRNVIFRNDQATSPVSSEWAPRPWDLLNRLQSECLDADNGCDVLSIPHNSNTSQGNMFALDYAGATAPAEQARLAAQRIALEPSVEVMQHKGDSECRNGLGILGGPDELCDFEKLFPPQLPQCDGSESVEIGAVRCTDVGGYVRSGLGIGLAEKARLGVNPFQFGFIAATDAHNGNPGQVAESSWTGHVGNRDGSVAARVGDGGQVNNVANNPGGIAAVWAEENSRDALFDAIRRRETYGTSGPRIAVRLFGGWDYPDDLCGSDELVTRGYADGVPMGGVLGSAPASGGAPVFALHAQQDPGTASNPGGLLQRAQIVKVWNDAEGRMHQRVHDVAGTADNGASVDMTTCEPQGPGARELCSVWRDPDFDPATPAVYYARVVENPSCRWQSWDCLRFSEGDRPETCEKTSVPKTIQERAWTSPIWYEG